MKLHEIGRQISSLWLGGITLDSNAIEKFRINDNVLSYYNRSWVYFFLCLTRTWLLI